MPIPGGQRDLRNLHSVDGSEAASTFGLSLSKMLAGNPRMPLSDT